MAKDFHPFILNLQDIKTDCSAQKRKAIIIFACVNLNKINGSS